MTPEEIEREAEHEDWCAERYAFLLAGHPHDLPPPFACGWCAGMVGTNGVQSKRGEHKLLPGEGTIHIDFAGTSWHYLCILEKARRI